MISIHNSLTRRKEKLRPLEPGRLRIYVCGLTVYDYCHLGHARMLVAFDTVVRYLRARGYDVTYVRNITDVDDKIIKRAEENGEPFTELTERFIKAMHEDAAALSVLPPDLEPRATAHIDQMIAMIAKLMDRELAYRADNGDVYFSVMHFPGYGRLSGKKPDELLDGARIEPGERKRDPRDFALWKAAPGAGVGWDSPWGYGRPGWHIECSAMSIRALGEHFDIHGGGSDLRFPHHENELAQSEGATGKPFANIWMHNGPLRVDNEKMAKSAGNFFTVRELLRRHHAEVVRHLLTASHYRSPINYSADSLDRSARALERFYLCLKGLDLGGARMLANSSLEKAFHAAMEDDFNTPLAIGALFDIVSEINRLKPRDPERAAQLGALLTRLGGMLGMLQADPEKFLKGGGELDAEAVERLVAARDRARAGRDWKAADAIRERLAAMRVVVEDGEGGSSWRVERG